MTKLSMRIHNTETDEIIDREMTDDEYAAFQADKEQAATHKEQAATDKAALLAKLGITADEAKLLLK